MTKTLEWVNPNKQRLVTGHAAFDRQLTAISAGQVLGGTQFAFSIRAATTTMNDTYGPKPFGHFRQWDLDHFPIRIPQGIRQDVINLTVDESVLLHVFFTSRDNHLTAQCWVAVRWEGGRKVLAQDWVTGPSHKAYRIREAVLPYITDEIGSA